MLFGRQAMEYQGSQTAIFRIKPNPLSHIMFMLDVERIHRRGSDIKATLLLDNLLVIAHPTIIEELSWTLDADVVSVQDRHPN